jgi:hypothetical protein
MEREPTDDERDGMTWWNGLEETARGFWAKKAGNTGRAADAWAAYKRTRDDRNTDERADCQR